MNVALPPTSAISLLILGTGGVFALLFMLIRQTAQGCALPSIESKWRVRLLWILLLIIAPTSAIFLLLLGTGVVIALLLMPTRQMAQGCALPPIEAKWRARLLWGLLLIIVLAIGVRVWGLNARGMTHVESYVPGLHLPAGISTPPARLSLGEVVWYHFHDEPHPQAYYLLIFAWIKTFGTSLVAIRLPSLIFNVSSIALLFFIVKKEANVRAAFLAAILMAFHGHQIYWSQQARMYSMGEFLGLLSVFNLLRMIRGDNHKYTELTYILATWGGVATKIFFWPFLAAEMLLVACLRDQSGKMYKRIFALQSIVVILGTPLWTHALYRARSAPLMGPSFKFAGQYLGLGNLFEDDLFSLPTRMAPLAPWIFAIALTVLGFAMAPLQKTVRRGTRKEAPSGRILVGFAVFTSLFICGLALTAHKRQIYLFASAVLPLGSLALPWFQQCVAKFIGVRGENILSKNQAAPFLILGMVPFLLLLLIGAVSPILKSRGMITFVPYVLAAVAIGWSRFLVKPSGIILVVVLFAWPLASSMKFFGEIPEPNDHRSITNDLKSSLREQDLIFVKGNDWVTTPSLYYLYSERDRLVGKKWQEQAQLHPQARIWVLTYSDIPAPENLLKAIGGRKLLQTMTSRRCKAELYGLRR